MILFKANVRLKKYTPALRFILETLDNLNKEKIPDYPDDWTVTSINDSQHMQGSKHYVDLALDLRSKNFENKLTKENFVELLKFRLGPQFTVLFENIGKTNEHFHLQVKKGITFNG